MGGERVRTGKAVAAMLTRRKTIRKSGALIATGVNSLYKTLRKTTRDNLRSTQPLSRQAAASG